MIFIPSSTRAQSPWEKLAKRPSTLGVDKGILTFHTPDFTLKLVGASQTVAALEPNTEKGFDFTPGDRLPVRSGDGLYHLGDLNLRIKRLSDTGWTRYSTATKRGMVKALPASDSVIAAADLAGTLPADIPLKIERYWKLINGRLTLQFKITNITGADIEIGDLGIPVIFNNIMEGKTLEEAHASNVFYDPYIGRDAGYLQVTRLSGHGPDLLVVPSGRTAFEAYNPLLDDPTPRGVTFEGFYEWMVHSSASAGKEWKAAQPWNTPTSHIIKPGDSYTFGLGFILSKEIKNIEETLAAHNRPVAIGAPGYVLPLDVNARLFLRYSQQVAKIEVEPAEALVLEKLPDTKPGIQTYSVRGKKWGRAGLTITYQDGLTQTVHYKVIKPESELVKDYGHFLTHQQWYQNPSDPFGRNNSVITYDYEKKQQVTQDSRAWIAGLSDEGGAGSWLGAMMKEFVLPDKAEIDKLQLFANHTLWGGIQHSDGAQKYGVKKSLFYYQPDQMPPGTYDPNINYKTWAAWDHKSADDIGRSYNYPHVAAAHWVLYRLARNHVGLVTEKNWQWHLNNAFGTVMGMIKLAPYYAQFGQMEGTVFFLILSDLKAEGWNTQAKQLEEAMKKRAIHWSTLQYPFGSEMPWDSTGQEEVYLWSKYFGYNDKATVTINAILGYMPTVPHWGYNGSARRYWDFLYGGKLSRIERQLHHYGSGMNAIPVLSEYRDHPQDLYLLRVGYGGTMGAIANITEDGFGPAAFHSFPSTLKIDGLSGDYGPNFFGYAVNSATYVMNDPTLGWLAFGGNLSKAGDKVLVKTTTAAKSRVFIAPAGLWLTLDAGQFDAAEYNNATGAITLTLKKADAYTPVAYLHLTQNAKGRKYQLKSYRLTQRNVYEIKLNKKGETVINLVPVK
ncbi:DUF5695 domain-containing protein [Mucilaginibacter sp. RS28]|uniref:DUF5695 domain-containing protein n=1 Tax=Mucilaginibacter straminoryzae TaxID=2932774 RepID=A0A9X1X323_9SPHI|nr:DUF5695 domain-containing protein [Mucilaginibacter straminoryzae]